MKDVFAARGQVVQSVGDIIGRAFRVYKGHLPRFLIVLLWPTIFATIFGLGLAISWSTVIAQARGSREGLTGALVVAVFCLLAGLLAKWILTLRQLALINLSLGFADDFKDAYVKVKSVGLDILAIFVGAVAVFCLLALLLAASFLFFVPKPQSLTALYGDWLIFAAVVLFALFLPVLLLITFMIVCQLICQRGQIIDAVIAGCRQTYDSFKRSIGFVLALLVVVSVISYPLSLPIILMSAFDVATHGVSHEAYQMPLYMMVIGQIWESFINMFLWPVVYLAYGLFYLDLRIRKEGLDLSRRLEVLQASAKEAGHGA